MYPNGAKGFGSQALVTAIKDHKYLLYTVLLTARIDVNDSSLLLPSPSGSVVISPLCMAIRVDSQAKRPDMD